MKGIAPRHYPHQLRRTIKARRCTEDDFRIRVRQRIAVVRVIEIVNPTITKEINVKLTAKDGFIEKDIIRDILPVAVINKTTTDRFGKGFIKGTGIKHGAIATTLTWDTGNILVIGSDERDMACAVNRLIHIQGGTVIAKSGDIIYEFPMELFGIIPLATMDHIYGKTKELGVKLREIGASLARPFLNIQTIPFTGLPFLRITDKGLADIKKRKLVSVVVR